MSPDSLDQDLGERLELRIFTLADYAVTPPDGKLYISGGGVAQMLVPELPGKLGPLFLAIRIRIPWSMTSESLSIRVRALSSDRVPVGNDPIGEARVEVGRAPGQRAGDELGVNIVIPLTGLPVKQAETVYFHVGVGEEPLGVLPLKVGLLPRVPAA